MASALFFPSSSLEECRGLLQVAEANTPQPMDLAEEGGLLYEMNPRTYSTGG